MPYKSEKIKLTEEQDHRRKLTTDKQKEIIKMYATGLYSWNQLANIFGCSKTRIGQIVNPERGQKCKDRIKEHWKKYQRTGEDWNKIQKEHRQYKQKLFLEGKLK